MCKRERKLDEQLQALAVDNRVHVMHRPMNNPGQDDAQLDTTFAYIIQEQWEHRVAWDMEYPLAVLYQVACKNPKDNFCRRIGRLIAKGRLTEYCGDFYFGINELPTTAEEWRELDDMVVRHYMEHME